MIDVMLSFDQIIIKLVLINLTKHRTICLHLLTSFAMLPNLLLSCFTESDKLTNKINFRNVTTKNFVNFFQK